MQFSRPPHCVASSGSSTARAPSDKVFAVGCRCFADHCCRSRLGVQPFGIGTEIKQMIDDTLPATLQELDLLP